jgi:Fe-S cluster assembly iron-binding protein IscA
VQVNGIALYLDPATAARTHGASLDVVQTPEGPAFRIENPNVPSPDPPPSSE